MHVVAVNPDPIRHLPVEAQQEQMCSELVRINKELPLADIIRQRRQAVLKAGDPYYTPFDLLMWTVVGDPYHTLGPRVIRPYPGIGDVEYGLNLFSGLSEGEDPTVMYVGGRLDSQQLKNPESYTVHTMRLSDGEYREWFVKESHTNQRWGVLDVELAVGKSALTLVREHSSVEDQTMINFRYPSLSDAQAVESERTFYSKGLLRNLYAVVHAFDEKYRHLEALYNPPLVSTQPELADIV
jgi:hypothetical protein